MTHSSPIRTLELARGEVLRLDAARGLTVSCDSGRLWITQERDPHDLWLIAGDRLLLAGRGLALVEADRDANVRIEEGHN